MFKVNNKSTKTASLTPYSSVPIVDFEQVNASWEKISVVLRTFINSMHSSS